ncbi:hypothetical protein FKP32DRAFT_1618942, partial [Trametes sanguinea]
MAMERLPYDVWHIVFQLACNDGGATGCALALTSKFTRRAAASTRFYSVALYSVHQVQVFLVCVERIRRTTGAEPVVQNLFLSFLPDAHCDAPLRNWRKWTDYARTETGRFRQLADDTRAWLAAKTEWNRRFILHVSRLFVVAGPSLRTLTILQAREVRLPLVRYHFPALRELTLLGDDRVFVRVPPPGIRLPNENDHSDFEFYGVPLPSTDGSDGTPFACLERLHVVFAFPKLHPWEQSLRQWAVLAPAISHLRISQGNEEVQQVLRDIFGLATATPPEHETDGDIEGDGESAQVTRRPAPVFQSLRQVTVQMGQKRGDNESTMTSLLLALQREVEEVSTLQDRRVPELRLLPARSYRAQYWPSRLRQDWEGRLSGGPGCWREGGEDEDRSKCDVANLAMIRTNGESGSMEERELAGKSWWKAVVSKVARRSQLHADIWDVIFGYACTDGGRTGAALALTSSSMRRLSAPYRFHSLKLTSLAQIGRLLLCVDRIERSQGILCASTADHGHGRVLDAQNLLLSFFPEDCESLVRPWRGWSEYSRKAQKRLNQIAEDERVWETAKGAWDRQFVYLVSRLFHLVTPTLRSLTILQHSDIRLPHIDITFPVLREVSLLVDDAVLVRPEPQWSNARDPESEDRREHNQPRFPSLTHLHVVHEGSKRHSWERTLLLWSAEAPALTHLRVSQASNVVPEVLEGLPTKAFQRTRPRVEEARRILTHSALRKVIIQPLVLQPV